MSRKSKTLNEKRPPLTILLGIALGIPSMEPFSGCFGMIVAAIFLIVGPCWRVWGNSSPPSPSDSISMDRGTQPRSSDPVPPISVLNEPPRTCEQAIAVQSQHSDQDLHLERFPPLDREFTPMRSGVMGENSLPFFQQTQAHLSQEDATIISYFFGLPPKNQTNHFKKKAAPINLINPFSGSSLPQLAIQLFISHFDWFAAQTVRPGKNIEQELPVPLLELLKRYYQIPVPSQSIQNDFTQCPSLETLDQWLSIHGVDPIKGIKSIGTINQFVLGDQRFEKQWVNTSPPEFLLQPEKGIAVISTEGSIFYRLHRRILLEALYQYGDEHLILLLTDALSNTNRLGLLLDQYTKVVHLSLPPINRAFKTFQETERKMNRHDTSQSRRSTLFGLAAIILGGAGLTGGLKDLVFPQYLMLAIAALPAFLATQFWARYTIRLIQNKAFSHYMDHLVWRFLVALRKSSDLTNQRLLGSENGGDINESSTAKMRKGGKSLTLPPLGRSMDPSIQDRIWLITQLTEIEERIRTALEKNLGDLKGWTRDPSPKNPPKIEIWRFDELFPEVIAAMTHLQTYSLGWVYESFLSQADHLLMELSGPSNLPTVMARIRALPPLRREAYELRIILDKTRQTLDLLNQFTQGYLDLLDRAIITPPSPHLLPGNSGAPTIKQQSPFEVVTQKDIEEIRQSLLQAQQTIEIYHRVHLDPAQEQLNLILEHLDNAVRLRSLEPLARLASTLRRASAAVAAPPSF